MGSDRARISYDPGRAWRSVVAQQGRVTLEADVNEASVIAQEALRYETIDIVGPAGTPDDGYKVAGSGAGDLSVGPGTMYLGGWRLTLDKPVLASAQPDWLDASTTKLDPKAEARGATAEAVLLHVIEQEVTATEDQVLREVALGGPDTAARTRLMQHIVRLPVQVENCEKAQAQVARLLAAQGLILDPGTLELLSSARLQVGYVPPTPPPGPCDPPAEGGYLGADNQLVRVSVTAFDAKTGKGRLVWGYNNASVLYRCTAKAGDTLTLVSEPIDAEHQPRSGQAVEVLRTRAALGHDNYIAAPDGVVSTLAQPYVPDTRTVTLPASLPAGYAGDPNGPLFLRLWEAERDFVSGQPVVLDPTGLQVTITIDALPALGGRPFWCFAVRPSTPVQVYPARYADGPQPPQGARQWLCPLAVVAVKRKGVEVVDDCRIPFLPLTKLKNDTCCAVTVGPDQVAGGRRLQDMIDRLAGRRAVLALRPGRYLLDAPIRLGPENNGLVIEGCSDGAVLEARPGAEKAFAQGLIVMERADEVTLRRLRFRMPLSPLTPPRTKPSPEEPSNGGPSTEPSNGKPTTEPSNGNGKPTTGASNGNGKPTNQPSNGFGSNARGDEKKASVDTSGRETLAIEQPRISLARIDAIFGSVGVMAVHCAQLTVEDCQFRYVLPVDAHLIAVGLYERSECWGLRLRRCSFLHSETYEKIANPHRVLIGYALTPDRASRSQAPVQADALLDDAEICDNRFSGVTLPVLVMARMGLIRCTDNVVRDSIGGFSFFTSELGVTLEASKRLISSLQGSPATALAAVLNPQLLSLAAELGRLIPRAPGATGGGTAGPAGGEITRLMTEEFQRKAAEVVERVSETEPSNGVGANGQVLSTDFDHVTGGLNASQRVHAIAVEARLLGTLSRPVLHVRDNDIDAVGSLAQVNSDVRGRSQDEQENRLQNQRNERSMLSSARQGDPFPGISVVLEHGEDSGSVLIQGNRVEMRTARAPAVGVLWPGEAAVTGNLLRMDGGANDRGAIGLAVLADPKVGRIDAMANLVRGTIFVHPPRQPAGPPESWEFLNTIG